MGKRQSPADYPAQAVWEDVLNLSDREQLQVYEWLRAHLLLGPGDPLPHDPQIEGRREALECMQRAVEHHRLPAGKAPTVEQYQQARTALGLPLTSQQVIRRWGYWRTAKVAFEGGRVPATTKQREHAHATRARQRNKEDYIEGLRIWLATEPIEVNERNYDAFTVEYNANVPDGCLPLNKSGSIETALALRWREYLAVAYGQLDLREAQEQAQRQRESERGLYDLVSTGDIARLLAKSRNAVWYLTQQPGFPVPVAFFRQRQAWYASDIEAFRDGHPVPDRVEGELQDQLLLSHDIASLVGLRIDSVAVAIARKDWHRIPRPAGKFTTQWYWDRTEVDQWQRAAAQSQT